MRARLAAFYGFDWTYAVYLLFGKQQTTWHDSIQIEGSQAFLDRTKEALTLLRPLAAHHLIREHIGCIVQSSRSGMKAWLNPPTFAVGRATWNHSSVWYAGAIAHDAYHSKLYRDRQHALNLTLAWTGPATKRSCLAFQSQVLSSIGADRAMVAYVEDLLQGPTYHGHHRGWRARLDYLRRWW